MSYDANLCGVYGRCDGLQPLGDEPLTMPATTTGATTLLEVATGQAIGFGLIERTIGFPAECLQSCRYIGSPNNPLAAPKCLGLIAAVGGLGYLGYRWWKSRQA